MADTPSKYTNKPFENLAGLIKRHNIQLSPGRIEHYVDKAENSSVSPEMELKIFREAMADVTPISFNNAATIRHCSRAVANFKEDEDQEALASLKCLIQNGNGFIVAQTPEYMESANPGASTEILRRLHQGHYAIQDFVDLHGLRVSEAEITLEHFMRRSIANSLRAVLVVHGRGLTSPHEPVLKEKVFFWLTRGRLRKWVIALTSARSCDGGAGATYVLLRKRPLSKSERRNICTTPSNST